MSNLQKSVSEHRVFLLTALERVENGEMATTVLKDAPVATHGLCTEILLGIQRWKGSLDNMIQSNVKRTPKTWIKRLLRMALYELYFLQRPKHAVINEAVELCKQSKYKAQSNFVNAVLRQMKFPDGVYANENFPEWLKELWSQNGKWLKSLQVPPKSGVVFASQKVDDVYTKIVDSYCTVEDVPVDGVIYTNQKGPIAKWIGYSDGAWWIMNPAAVYAVDLSYKIAAQKLSAGQPLRALDICAAPGGKTFRLKSHGVSVVSMDISQSRLSILEENAKRLHMDIQIVQQDGTQYNEELGVFDLVLLDAPCSGLGVIRKHPEIRWNRTSVDIQSNSIVQRRLLQTASTYVCSGGTLAYCVCSLHPEEGEGVIQKFLENNSDWIVRTSWRTPIDSIRVQTELLDGFQVYILQSIKEDVLSVRTGSQNEKEDLGK